MIGLFHFVSSSSRRSTASYYHLLITTAGDPHQAGRERQEGCCEDRGGALHVTCSTPPVLALKQVELRERDGASRDDVLFSNPRTGKPYSKNVLNSRLKSLIDRVASRWIGDTRLPGKPSDFFSAVSFRKAVLTRLKEGPRPTAQILDGKTLCEVCLSRKCPRAKWAKHDA